MMLSSLTVFVFGYWGAKQLWPNASDSKVPLLCGLFGALAILMIETVLFVIRMNSVHEKSDSLSLDDMRHRKQIPRRELDAILLREAPPSSSSSSSVESDDIAIVNQINK